MSIPSAYGFLVASLSLMLGWLIVIAAFVLAGFLIAACVIVEALRNFVYWLDATRKRVLSRPA